MDPVSIFVGLLVDAVRPTAQQAVADAYATAKTKLVAWYGARVSEPIADLEAEPDSPARRTRLATAMRDAGVERNPDVQTLLGDLSYLVENLTLPPEPVARVTRAKRQAGAQALHAVMDEHFAKVVHVRRNYDVDTSDLLTNNLGNSGLPDPVRQDLATLHERMRALIRMIADRIEDDAYLDAETALEAADYVLRDRARAVALVRADRALHTSYQTLQLTVGYLKDVNEQLLQRIENAADAQQETKLMLGNAVLIYEVTDYVIRFIRDFSPLGRDQLRKVWEEKRAVIKAQRAEEEEFRERVLSQDLSDDFRESTLSDSDDRLQSWVAVENEWRAYMDESNSLGGMVDDIRRQIGTLEIIRDNAGRQIATLQEVAFLRFLKQNTVAIKRTADSLAQFRLAPLTESRVRRLLQA